MAIGALWLPTNLRDYKDWRTTCYAVTNLRVRDGIKYDLEIAHPADDFSLVYRWINLCTSITVYMLLPDEQGFLRRWEFDYALPSNGNLAARWFTVVCSQCNVHQISSLPGICMGFLETPASYGIEVDGSGKVIFR